jgi:hypothetical protein
MIQTLQAAGFSSIILSEIYSPETNWAKMGDTCFLGRDENRKLSSFGTRTCKADRCVFVVRHK